MALKGDRYEPFIHTDYFMNETAEAGTIVVFTSSSGVGTMLDDANATVELSNVLNGSGEFPAGLLTCDVVNKDLTQTHLNQYNPREVQVGGKVGVARKGQFTTNMLDGSNPVAGRPAYFTNSGLISATSTNSTRIGTFMGDKDADGYIKIDINLP